MLRGHYAYYGIAGNIRALQEFQRYHAVQPGIFYFVNDTHASATEILNYVVVRNCLADHWSRSYLLSNGQVNEDGGSTGDLRQIGDSPYLAGTNPTSVTVVSNLQ